MTMSLPVTAPSPARVATRRRYLMCPPEHFAVSYAINPWMDLAVPVDGAAAMRQWDTLRRTYLELGHDVEVIPAEPGLPDMVFAANGGLVINGHALGAVFAHEQRRAEGPAYQRWFSRAVSDGALAGAAVPGHTNEGEGDFLTVGGKMILAGYGFRTEPAAHAEVQEMFGIPVIGLHLVDPRYYHLDTALAVLDEATVAYYPDAFSEASRAVLSGLFPDAILASDEDAAVLGLNAVSDGYNVVLSAQASGLADALRERGFNPVGVDLSELLKAGGGAKCCTLELRP